MVIRIPLSVPLVGAREQQYLAEALAGGWIAPAGPDLRRFEDALAERTGRACAVAVSSGTAALHLQLVAAGVGPGDYVICPTLTFVATANAITYTGATPVFVDCDETGNLDPALVEEVLAQYAAQGAPISAVLPVDLYGKVADHARLGAAAGRYGAVLLVDAAESLGATAGPGGAPAGSQGLAAATSFNGNKIITASSGGAVLTDDEDFAARVTFLATQAKDPVPYYVHRESGFNYRLSNILAALGRAQLERLDEFVAARRAHRERYRRLCAEVPGLSIFGGADEGDNCWLTTVVLDDAARLAPLMAELAAHGIESRHLFTPLHLQPLFADAERYPRREHGTAEGFFVRSLSLPSSPASRPQDVDEVCDRIATALTRNPSKGSSAR